MAIDPVMESASDNLSQLAAATKRFAQRFATIGENRLELLIVEVQEERERLLHAILLTFGVAAFGLLAAMALSVALAFLLWDFSPVGVLLTLTGLHGVVAVVLYQRLIGLLRDWQTLPATLDQLRKDRECLEKTLG